MEGNFLHLMGEKLLGKIIRKWIEWFDFQLALLILCSDFFHI
jgi:hypothetical protein